MPPSRDLRRPRICVEALGAALHIFLRVIEARLRQRSGCESGEGQLVPPAADEAEGQSIYAPGNPRAARLPDRRQRESLDLEALSGGPRSVIAYVV